MFGLGGLEWAIGKFNGVDGHIRRWIHGLEKSMWWNAIMMDAWARASV